MKKGFFPKNEKIFVFYNDHQEAKDIAQKMSSRIGKGMEESLKRIEEEMEKKNHADFKIFLKGEGDVVHMRICIFFPKKENEEEKYMVNVHHLSFEINSEDDVFLWKTAVAFIKEIQRFITEGNLIKIVNGTFKVPVATGQSQIIKEFIKGYTNYYQ